MKCHPQLGANDFRNQFGNNQQRLQITSIKFYPQLGANDFCNQFGKLWDRFSATLSPKEAGVLGTICSGEFFPTLALLSSTGNQISGSITKDVPCNTFVH